MIPMWKQMAWQLTRPTSQLINKKEENCLSSFFISAVEFCFPPPSASWRTPPPEGDILINRWQEAIVFTIL